jgi:hypothetical protein
MFITIIKRLSYRELDQINAKGTVSGGRETKDS